jgi:hypothetical protein
MEACLQPGQERLQVEDEEEGVQSVPRPGGEGDGDEGGDVLEKWKAA